MTFSPFAQTPNELSAAHLVDEVASEPRAAKLISFLDNEPFPKLPGDLEKITPDGDLTAVCEIGFSGANIQKLTLESRLDDLHNGFSSNMKVNGVTVNLEDRATCLRSTASIYSRPIPKVFSSSGLVWRLIFFRPRPTLPCSPPSRNTMRLPPI
jgi:hypothetical protein